MILVLAICLLAGCGTLFLSKTASVQIDSDPVEATVLMNGGVVGVTPLELTLPTGESHVLTFSKEGYQTVTCTINRKVSTTILVLDVLGGLVPVIVDAVTGGWYKLDKDSCTATLPPE